ncbi:MAG: HEPN domain-containing protein [Planctomycetota bacterium]
MQPTSARDYRTVARQRLDGATEIMEATRRTLEAQYIGGYSVECSLKALILERTSDDEKQQMLLRINQGAKNHRPEVLLGQLRELGIFLTPALAQRMRRFKWSTALRYEAGRKDTGETRALLNTARAIYEWVEPQIQ